MSEKIQDARVQKIVDNLSSQAKTSSALGSAAAVVGLVAGAVVAGPLAASTVGLGAGLGGAVLAGIALAKKLRLERSITEVQTATQSLESDSPRQQLLVDKLSALEGRQVTAEAVGNIVKEVAPEVV